jgi:hypothetical protein
MDDAMLDAGCWMRDAGCWMLDDDDADEGNANRKTRLRGGESVYTCVASNV